MRKLLLTALTVLSLLPAGAAGLPRPSQFKVVCDTLTARCNRRFNVRSWVSVDKVYVKNGALDLFFNRSLADYPWHEEDVLWFMKELNRESADIIGNYGIGSCMADGCRLEELATPRLSRDGKYRNYMYSVPPRAVQPFVRRAGARQITKGLYGRHIVLWQSHGRYFNKKEGQWKWQRATLHRTVEDLYTQSYILQGVIPMLENAGAYVMTPRERDIQTNEVICDNDPSFENESMPGLRGRGSYYERGRWETAPAPGFADAKAAYDISDNPFRMGSARQSACSVSPSSSARWTPSIPERGEYAVYVSYQTLKNSCREARYTVRHLGGDTTFLVDQRKGGGTWVYLGTFEFAAGKDGWVELDNKGNRNEAVSADAVRFGGGMGKVDRGAGVSGMPSYCEGASYWMPWAGADSTLRAWDSDYTNDYATRGAWTRMMMEDKGIPFDCSLAFHSDAGATPNDSIIGTLAIYTLRGDEGRTLPDGTSRLTSRTFCDFVQTQIVDDLRESFEPKWSRRMLWDRSYSESRTTDVPALLLELLSHQNFADMKLGLDPSFRFTVSRAVYKGILKYLAARYECTYVVQPLPVQAFSAVFAGPDACRLSWKPTPDPLEPTAVPRGYTLYTRIDDGAFDDGVPVLDTEVVLPIDPGHLYTWKVAAWNDGGSSFPSELLSAGIPSRASGAPVLVVNNFDRVAAPAWIDTPEYAGFESRLDMGMPYMRDITYIGDNYEFRRSQPWTSDDGPGFGGSYTEYAGTVVAGNTFDYPAAHGASLMRLGRPFCSMSSEVFRNYVVDSTFVAGFGCLDLICGAQLTTKTGRGAIPERFQVFPEAMREALRNWTGCGGNVFVSGSRIATDATDAVYDFVPDPQELEQGRKFIKDVLGYVWASSYGTRSGLVDGMPFYQDVNPVHYAVPQQDGLRPASRRSSVWLRYGSSGVPASVRFDSGSYRVVSLGVPLECLKRPDDRDRVLRETLEFFR